MADLKQKIAEIKILVVGAGGIGCELLKNLAGTGFTDIDVIDLDTIEYSNLNRQFLFQREHIGKSKAQIAAEAAKKFAPHLTINFYHKSVIDPEFDVNYFKRFNFVMNALDNRAARNHVNRLCLAADVVLIESGSAGYLGQATVIKKGITECYECQPKAPPKTYPACTIRNTPSEPVHCVVWAKHLFNQLFGEVDPDEDVSPDINDSELNADSVVVENSTQHEENGHHEVITGGGRNANVITGGGRTVDAVATTATSTRRWVITNHYDPRALFQKLFVDDVTYLLSMSNLWKKRQPPKPLNYESIMQMSEELEIDSSELLEDQKIWSLKKCVKIFNECIRKLKQRLDRLSESAVLMWEKDDDVCMDFVTACANLRSAVFNISKKSRFDVKSMAGNIIPAIATTNAIVAGLMVMEVLKILSDRFDDCATTYLLRKPNYKGHYFSRCSLFPPNPLCYVCSAKPEVYVKLNCHTFTIKSLEEKILKQNLHMVAPDVEIDDNKGTIIISSEKGEISGLDEKFLSDLNINDGCRLNCDDFSQQFELRLIIINSTDLPKDVEFEILTDTSKIKAVEEPSTSKAIEAAVNEEEDELCVLNESPTVMAMTNQEGKKRKIDKSQEVESPKRAKIA